jgi:hypothetical protein
VGLGTELERLSLDACSAPPTTLQRQQRHLLVGLDEAGTALPSNSGHQRQQSQCLTEEGGRRPESSYTHTHSQQRAKISLSPANQQTISCFGGIGV